MIPIKLQLKNFLSYGPDLQTVDFSHHHLICLSGKNGHGKSALLDAITWALWGQARKVTGNAKPAQGLLHLGQTQMLVLFDFEFNGQQYRIRREYMQTYGKPLALLEFGIFDSKTEGLIPLTDKTIRATQQKIDQTLRLDFDTFVNSAFLRQGNANEFSKKSPKDRKQILASILGLDQYDVIRKLALEKTRQAGIKKQTIMALQEKFEQELATIPTITTKLEQIDQQLITIKTEEEQIEKEKKELNGEEKTLQLHKKEHEILLFQLEQCNKEKKQEQYTLRSLIIAWRNINYKKNSLPSIMGIETEKKRLLKKIESHQQQLQQNLEAKEEFLTIKEQVQQIEQQHKEQRGQQLQQKQLQLERFQFQKQTIETKIKELEIAFKQCKKEKTILEQSLQCTQEENKIDNDHLIKEEKQFEKRKNAYQQFTAFGNFLQKELGNVAQKKIFTQNDNNPSCPLCEQNLSASRRRFLKKKFAKQEQFLRHQLNRLHIIIPSLKKRLVEQHQHIIQCKEKVELQKEEHKLKDLQKQLYEQIVEQKNKQEIITKEIHQQQTLISKQEDATHVLQKNKEYQHQKKKLTTIEQAFTNNKYQVDQHKKTQEQLVNIEQQLQSYAIISNEINKQEERKQKISQLCNLLKTIKKTKKEYEKKIETYSNISNQEIDLEKQKINLEQAYKQLYKQKEIILQEKGSLQAYQKKLKELEQEYIKQRKIIVELNKTIDEYQTIATATSKDGIQALLIEESIPEIEQEANQLLAKLTNNQAHIIIDSLRDLQKGGTKETLDIKISDAVGIRSYELFSGGEAFRIDFALRIAISKLLARRAGTALQTLIIDEGFGSQDEEGIAQIMDALHKIQDDFSKIIVVSHLAILKDQFPVHLVIEKGARGSSVQIIELG
ncbi:MAG: SMC family ATPase [Candidatus Babeliales bacterium]